MKFTPTYCLGDEVESRPHDMRGYWKVFWRVVRAARSGANAPYGGIDAAIRVLFPGDTLEGAWFRQVNAMRGDYLDIPFTIRAYMLKRKDGEQARRACIRRRLSRAGTRPTPLHP